jgi:hypothetical protein
MPRIEISHFVGSEGCQIAVLTRQGGPAFRREARRRGDNLDQRHRHQRLGSTAQARHVFADTEGVAGSSITPATGALEVGDDDVVVQAATRLTVFSHRSRFETGAGARVG